MWCMSRDLWNTSAAVLNLTVLKTNKEYNIYCTNNSKLALLLCVLSESVSVIRLYNIHTHSCRAHCRSHYYSVLWFTQCTSAHVFWVFVYNFAESHITQIFLFICLSVYLSVHMCVHPCVFVSVCTCSNALLLGRLACWHFGVRAMQGEWCWLTAWNLFIIQP